MRNRLVISLALGVLVAVLAAGVSAGKGVSVDLPGGSSVDTDQVLPACSNLRDDDGDGLVDLGDSGCSSPVDGDESNPAPPTTTTPTTPPTTTTPPRPRPPPPIPTTGDGTTSTTEDTTSSSGKDDPRDLPGTKDPFSGKGDKGDEKSFSVQDDEGDDKSDDESIPTPEIRRPDGTPTKANPTVTIGGTGAAPIGVPNPVIEQFSIPPFLLPIYQACGTQYGIPVGGARLDQPDRDGVRNQPQRLDRRRAGLDAVHARDLGDVRSRRQQRRPQGPVQSGRRDLRRGPLPQGGRRRAGSLPGDLRLQPRRLVRRRGPALRQAVRQPPQRAHRLGHRPDRGRALPGRRQVPLRRRHLRAGRSPSRHPDQGFLRQRRRRDQRLADQARHRHLLQGRRSGGRRQRRRDHEDRREQAARQVHRPPRRLRQRVHLRRPRQHRQGDPGAGARQPDDEGLRPDHPGRGRLEAEGVGQQDHPRHDPPQRGRDGSPQAGQPGQAGRGRLRG